MAVVVYGESEEGLYKRLVLMFSATRIDSAIKQERIFLTGKQLLLISRLLICVNHQNSAIIYESGIRTVYLSISFDRIGCQKEENNCWEHVSRNLFE